MIGSLSLQLHLPGCSSLKEKRSRIRPILARLHREFNVSTAEIDQMDSWQVAVICCAVVSNNKTHAQQVMQNVLDFVEKHWPDEQIAAHRIEII
jgi:uncharacterized protein YlxP (DUF503 family)